MAKRRYTFTALFLMALFTLHAQEKNKAGAVIHNTGMGISFAAAGPVNTIDSVTYQIPLESSGNSQTRSAVVTISASDKMFVDLPGSYGGRLYLDTPAASNFSANRLAADSVYTEQSAFCREYWAVYAGMGMWDGVINCYTKVDGHYYVVSLNRQISAGKPGEEVNGAQLRSEDLQKNVFNTLQDSTDELVNDFTSLLRTVRIQK
ncbi:MAG: hypothetical protein WCT99_11555 [Bacteroidota bacterium]